MDEITIKEHLFLDIEKIGLAELEQREIHNSLYTEPHLWYEAEKEFLKINC